MSKLVESTDRTGRDYFHFALVFFGLIIGTAGVVITSVPTWVAGLVLVALGMAYFLLK